MPNLKFIKKTNISTFIKKQITFPKDTPSGYIFRYGSGAAAVCLLVMTGMFFLEPSEKTLFYLVSLLTVLVITIISGSFIGTIVTVSAVITSFLFVNDQTFSVFDTAEMILFLLVGILFGRILDIMRRVPLIRQFNKQEAVYQERIQTLENKLKHAQEEIKARDEFLSIASHELKTPLASSLLQIQIALHNIRNVSLAKFSVQDLLKMLETVEQQTQRLSRMIKDLLNVSLITTGKMTVEPEKVNLNEIITEAVEKVPAGMNKADYPISFTAKKDIEGKWDKVRMSQAISNLISNAIKYGNDKPVEVMLSNSNSTAHITIKDHGIGIPSHEHKAVFQRFERGKNSNSQKGLGVGLYITNQIIKAHKGTIKVKSREGHGSTFFVELPIKK